MEEADVAGGLQEFVEEGKSGALGVLLADPEGEMPIFLPSSVRHQSCFPWSVRVASK